METPLAKQNASTSIYQIDQSNCIQSINNSDEIQKDQIYKSSNQKFLMYNGNQSLSPQKLVTSNDTIQISYKNIINLIENDELNNEKLTEEIINHVTKQFIYTNDALQIFTNLLSFIKNILDSHPKICPQRVNQMLKVVNALNQILCAISNNDNDQRKYIKIRIPDDDDENKEITKKVFKKFSISEDIMLKNIVSIFGAKNWKLIALLMPNRTARQCRDRYANYLAPGFTHSEWTNQEDQLLSQKYLEYGPCWSKIQKFFPNRTSNSIKNRYNYTIKKQMISDDYQKDINESVQGIKVNNNDILEMKNDVLNTNLQNHQYFYFENFDINDSDLQFNDNFY